MAHEFGLISVIIPVYNGAQFVADAIESVLTQAYAPLEVIVVDDGSTDDTATVVRGFGMAVQYHYQSNSGSSVARNHGVRHAKGEWLAFLDADDLWAPGKLQKQTEFLRQNPTVDLVCGHVVEFFGTKSHIRPHGHSLPGHHPGTMLISQRAFSQVGNFSSKFHVEVVEWMTRVIQSDLKQIMLPDAVMYRRIHQTNKGKVGRYSKHEYLHIIKKHLDNKRKKDE